MESFVVPRWAWLVALAGAGAAFLLVLEMPGDAAYWISVPLTLPLVFCFAAWLEPWNEGSRRRRVVATTAAIAVALPVWPLLIMSPGPRSWLVASLLCLPLMAVLGVRFQGDEDEEGGAGTAVGGPAGPPPA